MKESDKEVNVHGHWTLRGDSIIGLIQRQRDAGIFVWGVVVGVIVAVIACAVCCCLLAGSGPHVTVGSGPRPDRVMMNSVCLDWVEDS